MTFARADNSTIATCLEAMRELVIARGGYVHPGAYIEERDGALRTMCSSALSAGEPLFRIPDELLVPVGNLTWENDEATLRLAGSSSADLSQDRAELLNLFITIYNASNKLPWARDLAGYVLGRDKDIAEWVGMIRPGYVAAPQNLAQCFIDTRTYSSKHAQAGMAEQPCMMPLIDFSNNNFSGSEFHHGGGTLRFDVNFPDGPDECFARYGTLRDPLGLALTYGYIDRTFPYAQSVPVELDFPGYGQLRILAERKSSKHPADPPKVEFSDTGVTLSHLSGNAREPGKMKAILRLALTASGKRRGIPDVAVERTLADLPAALMSANVEKLATFCTKLASRQELPLATLLADAVRQQLSNLEKILAG